MNRATLHYSPWWDETPIAVAELDPSIDGSHQIDLGPAESLSDTWAAVLAYRASGGRLDKTDKITGPGVVGWAGEPAALTYHNLALLGGFTMAFMTPEYEQTTWIVVTDTTGDSATYPADAGISPADAVIGAVETVETVEGWGVRLSAPGYLDSTDWALFATESECREYLATQYDVCPDCGAELEPEDGDVCAACA